MDAAKLCFTHTAGHLSNSQPQHARPTECNWWRHWINRHKVGPSARHCRNIWGTISLAQQSQRCQHQTTHLPPDSKETRWSPRTRMLTRMLMVQMSKHVVMQSRAIPFCNSLFEQSCTCFPCYQSAVWSGKCRAWSVECEVRSVECKVWSGECRVCKV